MEKLLGRFAPHAYALLRIITGVSFALHGTQKLFGWPGENPPVADALMKAAGAIELITGVLVAIGLFTSIAAFIASGQMAVAYFMMHAPQNVIPNLNKGEITVLFCFVFLFIAAHGSGIWSADRNRGKVLLRRYEPHVYSVLRIVAGVMFLLHGSAKLWGWPGDREPVTSGLPLLAGWIEVITGAMIALGIGAGYAAFIASGTMAVAYFKSHAPGGFFPIVNRGELAVLYCFLWLYVATRERGFIGWGRSLRADAHGDAGAERATAVQE